MPTTLKKLRRHIDLGQSVHLSVTLALGLHLVKNR